jgi:hypothetical protein
MGVGSTEDSTRNGYCSDCYSQHYDDCACCGETYEISKHACEPITTYQLWSSRPFMTKWCKSCIDNHSQICECGTTWIERTIESTLQLERRSHKGTYMCVDCYNASKWCEDCDKLFPEPEFSAHACKNKPTKENIISTTSTTTSTLADVFEGYTTS